MIGNLFEIINFAIFTSLLIFAIKKYLAPQLREALVKKHRKFVSLSTEHLQLASDQKKLEKGIEAQEDEAMILFKKINRWRNVVTLQKKDQKEESARLLALAHAKARRQLEMYSVKYTYAKVVPLVTQRLEDDLKKQFSDYTKSHEYLNVVLEKL